MGEKLSMINFLKRGLKNLSFLTLGVIISMGIMFVVNLFLFDYLGENDFGIYILVGTSLIPIFGNFTMNQLSKIILREGAKDFSNMKKVLEETIGLRIALILFSMLICYVVTLFLPYSSEVKLYIILFSFDLIYIGMNSYLLSIFQALEKMQFLAMVSVTNAILKAILFLAIIVSDLDLVFLFSASLFTNLLTVAVTWFLTRRFVKFRINLRLILKKEVVRPMVIFSVILLLGTFATQIDTVMVSFLAGNFDEVGIYGFALAWTTPFIIMRNQISTAFFPIFVKLFHKGSIAGKKLLQISFLLGLVVVIGAAILSFSVPYIVEIVYPGAERSSEIFSILIYYIAFLFMVLPFNNCLTATHNEFTILKIVWIPPIVNIFLNIILYRWIGLEGIAVSTLFVQLSFLILISWVTWRVLKKQNKIY